MFRVPYFFEVNQFHAICQIDLMAQIIKLADCVYKHIMFVANGSKLFVQPRYHRLAFGMVLALINILPNFDVDCQLLLQQAAKKNFTVALLDLVPHSITTRNIRQKHNC